MKKSIIAALAVGLIVVCGITFFFVHHEKQKSKINANIQTRLEELVQNSDTYRFDFVFVTRCTESNLVNGVRDGSGYPDDIALRTTEYFTITVLKDKQKAKIEHTKTSYGYRESSASYTDTYTDSIYYIAIQDDEVGVFYPEDGAYVMRPYKNAALADAVSVLLFPEDVSYYNDDTPGQVITESGAYPHYDVQRDVEPAIFFRPFEILRDDSGMDWQPLSMGFGMNRENAPEHVFQYRITMNNITGLYSYAYEALTGVPYENELEQNGYSYRQSAEIYFYKDCNEVEVFENSDAL